MADLSPQAQLEHIIFLVREYEADLAKQESVQQRAVRANIGISQLHALRCVDAEDPISAPTFINVPTIEPKAQVYLERIEAWLESNS